MRPHECSRPVLGIIGCGSMGSALAELFTVRGFPLYIAGRDRRGAEEVAARIPRTVAGSLRLVADRASILILATPVEASHTEIATHIGPYVEGKILIDVSNPGFCDAGGVADRSAAELIAEAFPKSSVVKALNCVSARQLLELTRGGVTPTVPIAGDDPMAKVSVARILEQAGFDVADAGALSSSRWIEALTELLRRLGQEEGLGDAVGFRLLRLSSSNGVCCSSTQ